MIVANLIYDIPSLRVCTLTCYSWYIAAAPHLHYDLFINSDFLDGKFRWPNPLLHMHRLGLLPFVEIFYFRGSNKDDVFSSKLFNRHVMRQFSALTNVQGLTITYLDIPSFMPGIRRYFKHFMPTVRQLCLTEPKGSPRQLIYFIGLFEHLGNLSLLYDRPKSGGESEDDLTLTPTFTPPLGGQLRLTYFRRVGLLKDMVDLFGGIRFTAMDLFDVEGIPFLLDACAKTLKSLVLYPSDPRGEQLSPDDVHIPANNLTASSSLLDFDLSRVKSLQTIQVTAESIDHALNNGSLDTASSILKHALSTIGSPSFYKILVLYWWNDFHGMESWERPDLPPLREVSEAERAEDAVRHRKRFEVLSEVRKVRAFHLELSACVWDPVGEYSVRMLKEVVAEEKAKGGFDNFLSKPSVAYYPLKGRL